MAASETGLAPKPQHTRLTTGKLFSRTLVLLLGASLVAVALEIFLVPNRIIDGGVVGISIMLAHLLQIPLGVFLFLLNLPFLFLGYKKIGKTFALSTLFGVLVMSVGTTLLHPVPALTPNPMLASVFGGVILGVGVGLVIRSGGSLDGTEVVAILVSEKTPFSVGETVMFINIFILGSAGFIFGWDNAMYSLIAYYIAYKMIDMTMVGFDESKSVWIISERFEEIGDAIINRLGRGVTYLSGTGAYTGDDKTVVFCVITRLEEAKLKSIVDDWDPNAFLAVGNIHDVKGGRFKKKNIH